MSNSSSLFPITRKIWFVFRNINPWINELMNPLALIECILAEHWEGTRKHINCQRTWNLALTQYSLTLITEIIMINPSTEIHVSLLMQLELPYASCSAWFIFVSLRKSFSNQLDVNYMLFVRLSNHLPIYYNVCVHVIIDHFQFCSAICYSIQVKLFVPKIVIIVIFVRTTYQWY